MSDTASRFSALTAAIIGMDFALSPDTTAYWPRKPKPAPNPKKRAKVKAARKQRNRKT